MAATLRAVIASVIALAAWQVAGPAQEAIAFAESGPRQVVEIRSYNLVPGTVETFERLFLQEALPLLEDHGIDVVAYGRSLHDGNSWYLMRSFDDPAQRERAEALFYGSDEWRNGPREAILERIESYTTIVLPFDEETVERLRRLVKDK